MAALDLFPAKVPIVQADGTASPEFLRALKVLFTRVGGTLGDSGSDVFAPFLMDAVSEASIQQPAPEPRISETVAQPLAPAVDVPVIAQPIAPEADCPVVSQPATQDIDCPVITQPIDTGGFELTANKDASGGYAGLTALKINFKNALGTFVSFFTNANTAARTYTFQDRNGTIADDTDLALKASTASVALKANKSGDTFSGTVAYSGAYSSVYHADTSPAAQTIGIGGTVDFTLFSGMVIVNNYTSGAITVWLCGAGATVAVANLGAVFGTFAYNGAIAGYTWTNSTGASADFGFYIVRTRPTA